MHLQYDCFNKQGNWNVQKPTTTATCKNRRIFKPHKVWLLSGLKVAPKSRNSSTPALWVGLSDHSFCVLYSCVFFSDLLQSILQWGHLFECVNSAGFRICAHHWCLWRSWTFLWSQLPFYCKINPRHESSLKQRFQQQYR